MHKLCQPRADGTGLQRRATGARGMLQWIGTRLPRTGKELPRRADQWPNCVVSAGIRIALVMPYRTGPGPGWHASCIEVCRTVSCETDKVGNMEIPALGQFEHALRLRAQRNELLASNIANADTPNYKARDIDFAGALKAARGESLDLATTSDLHRRAWHTGPGGQEALFRVPHQYTLDGNTVETDVEQAEFAENALQYRAALAFLDGHIRTLKYAIKGGE